MSTRCSPRRCFCNSSLRMLAQYSLSAVFLFLLFLSLRRFFAGWGIEGLGRFVLVGLGSAVGTYWHMQSGVFRGYSVLGVSAWVFGSISWKSTSLVCVSCIVHGCVSGAFAVSLWLGQRCLAGPCSLYCCGQWSWVSKAPSSVRWVSSPGLICGVYLLQ